MSAIPPLPHQFDRLPSHEDYAHVMETLVLPRTPFEQYHPGQFVYVHDHAYETNGLAARECVIVNVDNAPLEIVVHPCNHPEQAFVVAQDKLSAPIEV